MSAGGLLQAAAVAALREVAGLSGVFDAPPVRSAPPHAVVAEPVTIDWGTKDMAGREARLVVAIEDGGERPVRLRALASAAEDALAALDGGLGDGWRLVTMVPVRTRITPRGASRWQAMVEFRARMLRTGD